MVKERAGGYVRGIALGACVAAALLVVPAAVSAAPPVKDDFSDVDCSKEQESMLGMKVCAGRELDKVEKAVKAKRKELLKDADKASRRGLNAWFKASDTYANALCDVERQRYAGGSMEGLVFGTCMAGEYNRQLKELDGLQNRPEGQ